MRAARKDNMQIDSASVGFFFLRALFLPASVGFRV